MRVLVSGSSGLIGGAVVERLSAEGDEAVRFDVADGHDILNSEAYAAAAQLRKTWTTFAATGDPGWPAYDPEHRSTQVFGEVTTVAAYPEDQSRLLWQDFPFSALPLLKA